MVSKDKQDPVSVNGKPAVESTTPSIVKSWAENQKPELSEADADRFELFEEIARGGMGLSLIHI